MTRIAAIGLLGVGGAIVAAPGRARAQGVPPVIDPSATAAAAANAHASAPAPASAPASAPGPAPGPASAPAPGPAPASASASAPAPAPAPASAPSPAGPSSEALFFQGRDLMAQHRYVEACAAFERAEAVHATIGVLLNLGDCYEQLGRLTRARSKFAEAEVTARRAGDAREGYARERALGVEARIPRLTVETSALGRVPGAALRIDGAEVAASRWASAIPLDPGRHTVAATAPRKKPWTVTFDLESSAVLRVPPLEDLPEVADGEGGAGGRWVWDAHHVVPLSLLAASAASVVVGIVLFTKSQDETNNEIGRAHVAAAMGLTPGQGTCSGSKTQACI